MTKMFWLLVLMHGNGDLPGVGVLDAYTSQAACQAALVAETRDLDDAGRAYCLAVEPSLSTTGLIRAKRRS